MTIGSPSCCAIFVLLVEYLLGHFACRHVCCCQSRLVVGIFSSETANSWPLRRLDNTVEQYAIII